ncbi:androgen-dependent TFPI-regulating protein-like [Plodia interpunctella]|uniref:androgen-dependent TFPI-regulating protein-like n=1 Tax=Plodia interpunctella TaxID=58824 RepID=UPI002367FFCE|nr:androgen-dependent TFPI-regulating protein-like [Plodia interpunctella]
MSSLAYIRIVGYVTTIVLHVGNLMLLGRPQPPEVAEDVKFKTFASLQARYLTVWTFFLQAVFASAGLWCDVLTLKNSKTKDYKLPKHLKGFRDVLFAAIVWPSVLVVSTTFWPIFIYDRSLVFPEHLDRVIPPISNHIMHTFIVPLALWEVLFQPRSKPRSHMRNILHILFHFVLYAVVLIYTYVERGIWIYPILLKLYGTVYFYVIFVLLFTNSFIFYAIQWPLTALIWGKKVQGKRKGH